MKRILITGMSGTGKSSVMKALVARGYKAVDTDLGYAEVGADGDWVWKEDEVAHLLSVEDAEALFLCGCAPNQGKFYGQFDHIVLLSAPVEVMQERLRTRTNNPFGKNSEELARILSDLETIEPLMRRTATHEIVTTAPLDQVVAEVLRIEGSSCLTN